MLAQKAPVISFEFFPPKTDEGAQNLRETIRSLESLHPSFVSVTYGAGGSTRSRTLELVASIKKDFGIEAVAHLTCVGHSQNEIFSVLKELNQAGIDNVLALRGDPPRGETSFKPHPEGFRYASELVRFIRKNFKFGIGVAGYPEKHMEAATMEEDMDHLKEKVEAGGDFVVTQLFFNNDDYFSFVERVRQKGVDVPITPGIMPITDVDQIKRFSALCGAKIPKNLLEKFEDIKNDKAAVVQLGIDHATHQCRDLLKKGAPGIHFYTLNKSTSTKEIFLNLKEEKLILC